MRQSIRGAIKWIAGTKQWGWTARLWTEPNVIAAKNGRTFTVKDLDAPADGLERLGCCGHNGEFYRWLGFDFDVGHGPCPYGSTERAYDHATALLYAAQNTNLPAALATSSGGTGIHVFVMIEQAPAKIRTPMERGLVISQLIRDAQVLLGTDDKIHPDPAPLSAQRFFLFNRANAKAHVLKTTNAIWE